MFNQYILDLKNEFYGYSRERFSKDLVAGITVAAVSLPLALAFAVSSGLSAATGLITAIISGLIIGTLAGASYQISGPTGTMAVILVSVAQQYGLPGVLMVTFLAGLLRVLAGVLRFGKVVYWIPAPVVTGFTSGIAIIIATGQIDHFFGVSSKGVGTIEKIMSYFKYGFSVDFSTVFIAISVVLLMIFWPKKWNAKLPSSLLGLVLAWVLMKVFSLSVATVGEIPKTLLLDERLYLGMFKEVPVKALFMPALGIATLGMIESLLCGSAAGRMKNEKFNANRELIAQGIGNMIIPFLGGMPATAALARTSVAIKAGGQTRLVSIIHSVTLIICMFALGGLMAEIPLAALAGVLVITAIRMNEWESIRFIFNKKLKTAMAQFLITMLATVIFDLTTAIILGVVFSILLFVVTISDIEVNASDIDPIRLADNGMTFNYLHDKTKVIYLTGPVFFTTIEKMKSELSGLEEMDYVIFSMRGVPVIDTTGTQFLNELCSNLDAQETKVMFAGLQPKVMALLKRSGMVEQLGEDQFFWRVEDSLLAIEAMHLSVS